MTDFAQIEAALKETPCFACHRPWGKVGLDRAQECPHVEDAWSGADCWYVPDFPALARAVAEMIEAKYGPDAKS